MLVVLSAKREIYCYLGVCITVLNPARRNALRRTHGLNPPTKGPTIVGHWNGIVGFVGEVGEELQTAGGGGSSEVTFSLLQIFFLPTSSTLALLSHWLWWWKQYCLCPQPFASPFFHNFGTNCFFCRFPLIWWTHNLNAFKGDLWNRPVLLL